MEMFYILIVISGTWEYTFAQTHEIVLLKLVNFIVCKLHLNKANKN